ncbi:nitroreductase family protein [Pseudochryseolinea flava]|uniref:Putative NAD(P)H nitroreductase n=1 Tax=Pseudochryseolinea flava TaxID=2059302 RepID=A0A364YBY5_9BACT|nr:nitroreductase [Pseudochryseolinea flava]RAW03268.1 nitroreductase [Pseudochryseolinea flava]
MNSFNTSEFNTLIRNRRSVFQQQFSGERVPDEIVSQLLENANWAPNHRLTEPWRFIVYTGDGIKKLAEVQAAVYKSVTEADGTFKEDRYQNLLTKPMMSSHIIAIAMKRDPKKSVPEIEEVGAVYCAIQNMYLTMTAYGVAGYLSTGGVTYFEESKEAFGLSSEDKLIGFFYLGMPKGNAPDSKRKPIEEKVIWITS